MVLRRVNPSTTVWYSAPIKSSRSWRSLLTLLKRGCTILVDLHADDSLSLLTHYRITRANEKSQWTTFSVNCAPRMRRVSSLYNSSVQWMYSRIREHTECEICSDIFLFYFRIRWLVRMYVCMCARVLSMIIGRWGSRSFDRKARGEWSVISVRKEIYMHRNFYRISRKKTFEYIRLCWCERCRV